MAEGKPESAAVEPDAEDTSPPESVEEPTPETKGSEPEDSVEEESQEAGDSEPEDGPEPAPEAPDPDDLLLEPLLHTGRGFYVTVGILLCIMAFGLFAYQFQYRLGLGVTGLNRPVYWGFYIVNFVFFIGISHAGTLISAILRICGAEWRRSITRCAEVITVLVLFFGVGSILVDLGQPLRAYYVITHAHMRSPLLWDVCSITCYLIGSITYLYLPMIPDIALLRDRMPSRRWLYRPLALGWTGSHRQHALLEKAIGLMAVIIIPIAVSVHTVVSWVFAMTVQPMWHSAIFGPYFVIGAIFSGVAALILSMLILRKVYRLEDYIKPIHFDHLGAILLCMTLLWSYFTLGEYLTTFYGAEPSHMKVFWDKFSGPHAGLFWTMVVTCAVIPFCLLAPRRTRTIMGTSIASVSILIGMWLERFIIVVPTLENPRIPFRVIDYIPTWVEWSIFASFLAAFILLYMLFTKFFPIISIWEVKEGREVAIPHMIELFNEYAPSRGPRPRVTRPGVTPPLIALALGALLLAAPRAALADDSALKVREPIEGMSLFATKGCIQCHPVLEGGNKVGPDLARALRGKSSLEMAAAFWNHSSRMMAEMKRRGIERPSLSPEEVDALFGYFHHLNYYDEPGNYRTGRKVISQKGCLDCHTVGHQGGTLGPALDSLGRLSPVAVAQAMWNHIPRMQSVMRESGIPVPEFEGTQFVDLMAYLRGESRSLDPQRYTEPGDPARGATVFASRGCLGCHSTAGKGGTIAPDLQLASLNLPQTQIAAVMWNHGADMAKAAREGGVAFPVLRENEMVDLLAYIYELQRLDPPGDPVRGARLFKKSACARCHTDDGPGPTLSASLVPESSSALAAVLWNHAEDMAEAMTEEGVPWPKLTGKELRDIMAYLKGVKD